MEFESLAPAYPATPAVAGVTFGLPRRGRGNFFTLVNPKSCHHTKKLPPIKVSLIILIYLEKFLEIYLF